MIATSNPICEVAFPTAEETVVFCLPISSSANDPANYLNVIISWEKSYCYTIEDENRFSKVKDIQLITQRPLFK